MTDEIAVQSGRPVPKNPQVQLFLEYLDSIVTAEKAPRKSDLRPERIGPLLNSVWLYQLDQETDRFHCVLAGQDVHDTWGGNISGQSIESIFDMSLAETLDKRWRIMLTHEALSYSVGEGTPEGVIVERLSIPLYDNEGNLTYIYGFSDYQGISRLQKTQAPELLPLETTFYRL